MQTMYFPHTLILQCWCGSWSVTENVAPGPSMQLTNHVVGQFRETDRKDTHMAEVILSKILVNVNPNNVSLNLAKYLGSPHLTVLRQKREITSE